MSRGKPGPKLTLESNVLNNLQCSADEFYKKALDRRYFKEPGRPMVLTAQCPAMLDRVNFMLCFMCVCVSLSIFR